MDPRVMLSLSVLLLVAFAGCTSTDDAPTTAADMDTDGGTDPDPGAKETGGEDGSDDAQKGNGTGGGGDDAIGAEDEGEEAPGNTPPTATLNVSADAGQAPFVVDFTLNGSDEDGDELTWSFDADEDGTIEAEGTDADLPATVSFNYTTAGVFNATLTVSDGTNETVQTVTITVEAPEPVEDVAQPEDRGWYVYHPDTGLCDVKDYVDVGGLGVLYESPLGGGDWFILETNGVPGLQVENNHPLAPANVGEEVAGVEDCVDGDQVLL